MRKAGLSIIIILQSFLLLSCGNKAIFDELATNRLKVIIKGTYESNGPTNPWTTLQFPKDDSVDDNNVVTDNPTTFMLDIAEMRLVGGSADKFANFRKTYESSLKDSDPFFDGTGVLYKNDDPYPHYNYSSVQVFIRKMILDGAKQFIYKDDAGTAKWFPEADPVTIFRERSVNAFDFNQLQYFTYFDSLRTYSDSINMIFPLSIPIDGGFNYDNEDEETVLEIRFVLKNFITKYEYNYVASDGYHRSIHYWAFSDWLRDVKSDENVIGGNLIATARTYTPSKCATITGTAPANRYVIAIEGDVISNYSIAKPTRPIASEEPKAPHLYVPNDIESILDYFLHYEKYKEDFNTFVNYCITNTSTDIWTPNYKTPWDNYETAVKGFRLPPLAAYSNGTYTLTNVPAGKTYYLYCTNKIIAPGLIPELSDFTSGQEFIVPISSAGGAPIVGPSF